MAIVLARKEPNLPENCEEQRVLGMGTVAQRKEFIGTTQEFERARARAKRS